MSIVVLALGSILFAACTRPGTTPTGNAGNTPTTEAGGGGTTVHMNASNFVVSSTTIPKGQVRQTLTFNSQGAILKISAHLPRLGRSTFIARFT